MHGTSEVLLIGPTNLRIVLIEKPSAECLVFDGLPSISTVCGILNKGAYQMVLSTLVKLKTIGLARQVVLGAFINGALIGATVVAGAAIARSARAGTGGLCDQSSNQRSSGAD